MDTKQKGFSTNELLIVVAIILIIAAIAIPILHRSGIRANETFARGPTVVVNAHGALIHLIMKVQVNDLLVIKHMHSGEERHSRVVRIDKSVVGNSEVAIEFTEVAPRFWHIDFPPADWAQLEG